MKKSRLLGIFLLFAIVFLGAAANAATWANINGRVLAQDGTPLCAMVLANGQHMFSCGGSGDYSLSAPLDDNNLLTLQVFAAGFAPYMQSLTVGQAVGYDVFMDRDVSGRAFSITDSLSSSSRADWAVVSGNIESNGTPLCAMILINGQSMFSCNQNLGRYSLEVPIDNNGNITLQAFAAGFQPYKEPVGWFVERKPEAIGPDTVTAILVASPESIFFDDDKPEIKVRCSNDDFEIFIAWRDLIDDFPWSDNDHYVTIIDENNNESIVIFISSTSHTASFVPWYYEDSFVDALLENSKMTFGIGNKDHKRIRAVFYTEGFERAYQKVAEACDLL